MFDQSSPNRQRPHHDPSLGRVVLDDLRRTGLQRDFMSELKNLYRFYVDEERRSKLARMGRIKGAIWLIGWLFKSLYLNLSPARRVSLLLAIVLAVTGTPTFRYGETRYSADLGLWGFIILLVVLMLELKDKLLAKDEIQIARQVQIALLPREHPAIPGWSVWSYSRPANDVGGDLVDYVEMGGFRHGVAMGDVAGKGLGAALLSAKLQATLRALVPQSASLDDLGTRVNEIFYRDGLDNRFATLFYAELEHDSGQLRYLNAGHNPAYVVRAGSFEKLDASSYPLGMMPIAHYRECSVSLDPGDFMLAYSDGLTEAENAQGEEFGSGRVEACLGGLRDLPPAAVGKRIIEDVDRFLEGVRAHDDLSLVVVVRTPVPAATRVDAGKLHPGHRSG